MYRPPVTILQSEGLDQARGRRKMVGLFYDIGWAQQLCRRALLQLRSRPNGQSRYRSEFNRFQFGFIPRRSLELKKQLKNVNRLIFPALAFNENADTAWPDGAMNHV